MTEEIKKMKEEIDVEHPKKFGPEGIRKLS